MNNVFIKNVMLEEDTSNVFCENIVQKLEGVPILYDSHLNGQLDSLDNTLRNGKETLHLLNYKGAFLKPCPGTKEYICCGYQILNLARNCPLDCSYCILQSYFDKPELVVFSNFQEELGPVLEYIDKNQDLIFRIGTGEFTDSLALDPVAQWSSLLLESFSTRKNSVLELKTKTGNIDSLLKSKYRDRIVVSWSLNSPYITLKEEHRALSLQKRLEAARECQKEGFAVGFHFDPLIYHKGWKEGYMKTLDMMDKLIDPSGILWISMGSFRYMPGLKNIIRLRHPDSCILNGEFIKGLDGKMRYFRPIRQELYTVLKEYFDQWYKELSIYLCMESHDVWESSFGWSPENSAGLSLYLDNRVKAFFGWKSR